MGTWSEQQLTKSIQWKEIFQIEAAAVTWGHQRQRKKLILHCSYSANLASQKPSTSTIMSHTFLPCCQKQL